MDYQLHTSTEAFDRLAAEWNDLLGRSVTNAPFLRHEYLRAWWQTLGGGEWPQGDLAIVTAHEAGALKGIAPLFFTENHDGRPALMLLGSIEISDYLDLIAAPADLPAFVTGLLDFLGSDSRLAWSSLDWCNLPDDSATLSVLEAESAKRGWTFTREALAPCPHIALPGDFDAYLEGIDKKQRHEIRRKMRRAEESGHVRWYIVTDEANLDGEVEAFLALMANDPEKANFLTGVMRTQMKTAVHAAFRAGWLQLAFLEVDGRKACAYLNFDYDNKVWVYNSGLDRQFMEYSPGWVLLGHLLQWANENKRAEFDFMRGDEEYKYRFGAIDRHVLRVEMTR
jgi:CelD/BcsL family acetyltransferase involved in cellulose biosynthesis